MLSRKKRKSAVRMTALSEQPSAHKYKFVDDLIAENLKKKNTNCNFVELKQAKRTRPTINISAKAVAEEAAN